MDRELDQINVIPLVDVMLVLLVIVLTTATFISTGQIPVDLAKAKEAGDRQDAPIVLTLAADGGLFVPQQWPAAFATLPPPVLRLAQRYMHNPLHINLSPEKVTVENIRQLYITVDEDNKFDLLLRVLEREQPRQCIIFCERKRWADEVYRDLRRHHKKAATMHGDLEQPERERIMQAFREGKVRYLVATDVVGRGIDVTNISHIINYDLPEDPENYVHRIGRTGRMGADGVAIAFVTPEQGRQLTNIEVFINKQLEKDHIEGFKAYTPRTVQAQQPKPFVPVFGSRVRRYSNRL